MGPELLEIEPRELVFTFELKKQSSCSVMLTNSSTHYVAFKVKTTNPKKYCVRPNTGVVQPMSSCNFTVTMQAQRVAPPDMQCKDKFLIQSIVVPYGTTAEGVTSSMFSKDNGKYIEENKLKVVIVSPPEFTILLPTNGVLKQESAALNFRGQVLNGVESLPPHHKVVKDAEMLKTAKDEEKLKPAQDSDKLKPAMYAEELKPAAKYAAELKPAAKYAEELKPAKYAEELKTAKYAEELKTVKSVEDLKPAKHVEELKPAKYVEELKLAKDLEELKPTKDVELKQSRDVDLKLVEDLKPGEDAKELEQAKGVDLKVAEGSEEFRLAKDLPEFKFANRKEELKLTTNAEDLKLTKVAEELKLSKDAELKLAKDVEELKSKLKVLESKLSEAEGTITKLREERSTSTGERLTLQEQMAMLRRNNRVRRAQAGFPFLFVVMVALIGVTLGYLLRARGSASV